MSARLLGDQKVLQRQGFNVSLHRTCDSMALLSTLIDDSSNSRALVVKDPKFMEPGKCCSKLGAHSS